MAHAHLPVLGGTVLLQLLGLVSPLSCLLCWGSCSSAFCSSAYWCPQIASSVMRCQGAPSVPGRCSSMGLFASPAEKLSANHPESSESQAVTHHVTSFLCIFFLLELKGDMPLHMAGEAVCPLHHPSEAPCTFSCAC